MTAPRRTLSMPDVTRLVQQLAKRRKRFLPEAVAEEIVELVYQTAITQAIETGTFKFKNGWGAFRLHLIEAKTKKLPTGETINLKPRGVLRYEEGTLVKELLGVERRPCDYKPGGSARSTLLVKDGHLLPDV